MKREKKKATGKVRVTLDLSAEFYQRLDNLTTRVDAESKASVLREALKLYEFVVIQREQGAALFLHKADGKEQEVMLIS